MSTASLGSYYRTIITVAVVLLATAFLFSSLRVDAWGLNPSLSGWEPHGLG